MANRKIPGFNCYFITDEGRVWSTKSNKYLSPYRQSQGYMAINLGDSRRGCLIHRLVLEALKDMEVYI